MARNQSDKTRGEVIFESHARILGELSVRMAALERAMPKADTVKSGGMTYGDGDEVAKKANQDRLIREDLQVGFLSELRWSGEGCNLEPTVRADLQAAMRVMARAMVRLRPGMHAAAARTKLAELGDAIVRAATLGEK